VRVGVLLLPTDPWAEAVARVRDLEAAGYDHIWTYDHLSWRRYRDRPWFAAIPWLTGLAAATSTVRLGTMVASPNFRHPVTFAKEAMTLDHISGGRLTLGLGSGGTGFDADVLGEPPLSTRQRVDRFAEFVALTDRLLREPETTHHGRYYRAEGARMLPPNVQRPRLPLAVAATGRRTLGLVARYGDAWITYGDRDDRSPAGVDRAVRRQAAVLAEECAEAGRDPADLDRIYLIGNTEERPLASVAAFVDFAGRFRELGFTDLVFHHPRPDDPVWTEDPAIVEAVAGVLPTLR
jgi:alkanesulfonate monooxygenase SsuD/methylene tetrahydromethanopterin reductase-like flavin-dependent oxidoreductase (luciferase family)